MEYFTKAIDKYFASWILPDTWHTNHPSDMARFYRFIIAINHFSKPIKLKPLDLNDPSLAKYPEGKRAKFAKILVGSEHNPRTYDEKALKGKIILAVERNHPNFDKRYAEQLVDEHVKKAIIILDALWGVKKIGFPHLEIQRWKPPLK